MSTENSAPFSVMEEITGTHWGPGDGKSSTIKDWLNAIAAAYPTAKPYCESAGTLDYFEWCGLTVGYCYSKGGFEPPFGSEDTSRFLWAAAWLGWGENVATPTKGDVVVFDWGGGHHHVTLFERDIGNGYWACRGGNQAHEVKISNFPASRVSGVRKALGAPTAMVAAASGAEALTAARATTGLSPSATTFKGDGSPLTQAALEEACGKLGVGAAEIWSLITIETDAPHGGFNADKRPQILFERHIFSKLTQHRFDAAYPDISNSHPGGYGLSSAQYDRLSRAMGLDETAALQSASWGIGQVLGENFREAGFASPQDLVTQLFVSEDKQLSAVANEIISDRATRALATHDWSNFARIYNGPNYAGSNYDGRLRDAFEKFSRGTLPDLRIRTAQVYLMYLGYEPRDLDGVWGRFTKSALNAFQAKMNLPVTDGLDEASFSALETESAKVPGVPLTATFLVG